MTVVSFRIPKRLKKSMGEINTNWSKEVRTFIELRARRKKKEKAIAEIMATLERMPAAKVGTADRYIRDGRDSD